MPKRRPDHQPQRSCAVCRSVHDKKSMTRVVRRPDGMLALDPTGRAAGRGTYLCDEPACRDPKRLAEAVRRTLGTDVGLDALVQEAAHAPA